MAPIRGTNLTKEKLIEDLKKDKIECTVEYTNKNLISLVNNEVPEVIYKIGLEYHDKKQDEKAMAWYLLAAQIGYYEDQSNVQWKHGTEEYIDYLSVMEGYIDHLFDYTNFCPYTHVGGFFERGDGVPQDKYKALEWYRKNSGNFTNINRLKSEGYHVSWKDKLFKSDSKLISETKAIIQNAREQKGFRPKKQTQTSFKDRKTQKEVQKLDDENKEFQKLISSMQKEIKAKDDKIVLLQEQIDTLSISLVTTQHELDSIKKDTEYHKSELQSLFQENAELKREKESIEIENRLNRTMSMKQASKIDSLKLKNEEIEEGNRYINNEINLLKATNDSLAQHLKAKDYEIRSLNREKVDLIKKNRRNLQKTNETVEELQSLLQSNTAQIELTKQNMQHMLDKGRQQIKKLQKENETLKQQRMKSTGIHRASFLIEKKYRSTSSDSDNASNDINYDTEYDTEDSDNESVHCVAYGKTEDSYSGHNK